MKKEYMVVARQKFDPDKWWNVGWLLDSKRVYKSLEEAQGAVNRYLERWNSKKVYNDMRVIEMKIKCREVTDWEEEVVEI